MKLRNILSGIVVGAFMFSCNNTPEKITTESGLEIAVITAGTEEIEPGMTMLLDFVIKNESDSVIMSTTLEGMPRPARKVDSLTELNKGGIEEVIYNLKKGDSVFFIIPTNKLYGKHAPPQFQTSVPLKVNMAVRDAMSAEAFQAYRMKMQEEMSKEQLAKDVEEIDAYLAENNIEAIKLESGLRYVITQEGEGENVKSGETITANYSGYVLGGDYFDSSIEEVAKEQGLYQEGRSYEPFETVIGQGAVIKGWDEGFQLLNKGSKATFYIPSPLAYGPRARSKEIGPNSILVFDLELIDIK